MRPAIDGASELVFRAYENRGAGWTDLGVKHCTRKLLTMTALPFNVPPKMYARIGGVLYLIVIAVGLFGVSFIRERLIVSGDATAGQRRSCLTGDVLQFGADGAGSGYTIRFRCRTVFAREG